MLFLAFSTLSTRNSLSIICIVVPLSTVTTLSLLLSSRCLCFVCADTSASVIDCSLSRWIIQDRHFHVANYLFLEKNKASLLCPFLKEIIIVFNTYRSLSSNDSRATILNINLLGTTTWQSRNNERYVKGGALWGASTCLLSARACSTATHTIVHKRVCVRERVWAPVTVVIVVNLTTVKAVTACPYKPVYAIESRALGAAQYLARVEIAKRPAFPGRSYYIVESYTAILRGEEIGEKGPEKVLANWLGRLIERRGWLEEAIYSENTRKVHPRDEA